MTRWIVLMLALGLAACAATPSPAPAPLPVYQPPLPTGVQMRDIPWTVLDRDQAQALVTQADQSGQPLALFALTPQGFENLALNIQELKRYILEQQEIILYYRKTTGAPVPVPTEEKHND